LWTKLEKREHGAEADPFVDSTGCRRYAESARLRLNQRLAQEDPASPPSP
jgi:hypothetical protein